MHSFDRLDWIVALSAVSGILAFLAFIAFSALSKMSGNQIANLAFPIFFGVGILVGVTIAPKLADKILSKRK